MGLLDFFRPRLSLRANPLTLAPGQKVELRAIVDASRPARVESFELWLEQRVSVGGGSRTHWRQYARLAGAGVLPKGPTELGTTAWIPQNALPDHSGTAFRVATLVHLHLRRRWRLDVKRSFQLQVVGRPTGSVPQPLLFSSRRRNTTGPYLEGSLDRSVLRPGGVLTGRVSVMGADANGLEVALVCREHVRSTVRQSGRWTLRLDRKLEDGDSVPFSLQVPASITPGFRGDVVAISWQVELRAVRSLGRDLTLPIPVEVSVASADEVPVSSEAPVVGRERLAAVWRHVGDSTGMAIADGGLRCAIGDVVVRVRPGEGLEAQLLFPDLGLDLEGGERTGLMRLGSKGEVPGLGEWWNQRCYLTSREPEQAAVFLARATGRLVGVSLREASDLGLTLAVDASDDDRAALERLVQLARRVAERIPHARAAVPMPQELSASRPAWEAAAERFGARFDPGPPALIAPEGAWHVSTHWPSDEPTTHIGVRSTTPIDARLFANTEVGPLPDALSRDARGLAETLASRGSLHIGPDGAEAIVDRAFEDPADADRWLDPLQRLVRLLRVDAGPYR